MKKPVRPSPHNWNARVFAPASAILLRCEQTGDTFFGRLPGLPGHRYIPHKFGKPDLDILLPIVCRNK